MHDIQTIDSTIIQNYLSQNLSFDSVSEHLRSLGLDEELREKYVAEWRKLKYGKRQARGTIFFIVGGLLGFISCLLAMINPVPELHGFFLYGLTSVAVLLVCYGLYNIFE